MPHFGIMNEEDMRPDEAHLLRAKLHIRCGIRRLHQRKYSAGMATIYDAIIAGMRWFLSSDERLKKFGLDPIDDLHNEENLFTLLNKIGVINQKNFEEFHSIMELGLVRNLTVEDINVNKIIFLFEQIMNKLGIMPFDFNELPPENPNLF